MTLNRKTILLEKRMEHKNMNFLKNHVNSKSSNCENSIRQTHPNKHTSTSSKSGKTLNNCGKRASEC